MKFMMKQHPRFVFEHFKFLISFLLDSADETRACHLTVRRKSDPPAVPYPEEDRDKRTHIHSRFWERFPRAGIRFHNSRRDRDCIRSPDKGQDRDCIRWEDRGNQAGKGRGRPAGLSSAAPFPTGAASAPPSAAAVF